MPDSGKTQRTTVWALVALVAVTMAAVVALALAAPEGEATTLVTQVLGTLAPVVAVLAAMRQVTNVGERVDRVAQDTHDLTNGLLGAQVRVAAAEVLRDDLVDPSVTPQLVADKLTMESSYPTELRPDDVSQEDRP